MKRTGAGTIVGLTVFGVVAGFLTQMALAAASVAKLRPEYTLALSLGLIAGLIVVLAVPVRRSTHGEERRPVDPFYATRVVVLAKASSVVGALLGGFAVGLLGDLLVRSVAAPGSAFLPVLAMLGGATLLLAAGLVAEWLCTVPPEDDDDDPSGPVPAG